MKKYRLKQWYPSLDDDIEVGTIVDYEDGWIYYINKRGNKTTVELDEWELSHKDFWELIEEEKPLFVTEDGVKIYHSNQPLWEVMDFKKVVTTVAWVKVDGKYFFHEANADKYIWRNKRVFSYEDIEKFQSGGEGVWYDVKAIAIGRSKE